MTFQIYQVTDGSQGLTDPFQDCPVRLSCATNEQRTERTKTLARYVEQHRVPATGSGAVLQGTAAFSGLEPGLYLVLGSAHKSESGTYRPAPVTLWIPAGASVSALIKPEAETPAQPEDPTGPRAPELPQTGQLWWPVPCLALAGGLLLAAGLRRARGAKRHET